MNEFVLINKYLKKLTKNNRGALTTKTVEDGISTGTRRREKT